MPPLTRNKARNKLDGTVKCCMKFKKRLPVLNGHRMSALLQSDQVRVQTTPRTGPASEGAIGSASE